MKLKKPKIPKIIRRRKEVIPEPKLEVEGEGGVPRITNETVAEHREEVLSTARKYIYPLQHSKHKIVLISSALFILSIVIFFTFCVLSLYRFKSSSTFVYGVTKVIPFPIAKAGSGYVSYENYLFELRHYVHYYETQLDLDFTKDPDKQQLEDYRRRALDKVVNDAYVKQLASKHKVSVSGKEVDDQIAIVRSQNRLGASDKAFEDVLKENFGWSVNDFKRSLKQQILAQKVVASLDTESQDKANAAIGEIRAGADFAEVAKKYSDDTGSKDSGGEFGFLVDRTNRDISPQTIEALFKLQPGQTSNVINTGYTLEIVKNLEAQGDKIRAAHIQITLKDIGVYVNELKNQEKTRLFVSL